MSVAVGADVATLASAAASAVYAVIAAVSLFLLSRQIRDARRFGAAPALYGLLKELEEHMAAVRGLSGAPGEEAVARETILRYLEFFERVEHLASAGVLPVDVLRRAFGPVLEGHLADPRFSEIVEQNARQHREVLQLSERLRRA